MFEVNNFAGGGHLPHMHQSALNGSQIGGVLTKLHLSQDTRRL